MSEHKAEIRWYRQYASRLLTKTTIGGMRWWFEGGIEVAASAAPEFRGNRECVDPEEAFVASLSSCHMLTFLAIASKKRLLVDSYVDHASGEARKECPR